MFVRIICNKNDAKDRLTARIDGVKCIAHSSKTLSILP